MRSVAALCIVCAAGLLARPAAAAPCPPAAYLTFEEGRLAAVDWVTATPAHVHTRSELTQSAVIDSTVGVRDDGSVSKASTTLTMAGSPTGSAVVRTYPRGTVYWSDMVPSSLQQAIDRARSIGGAEARVRGASLFSSASGEIEVDRVDATDWTVAYHGKKYLVLTDTASCVVAASLPAFGVTIERRPSYPATAYPMWAPYAAPPDRAYASDDVVIPASEGIKLAGTLTRPARRGRAPAAILITGLSPHERNNGVPPWMPLRDIADSLTRAGFAVLRVDDRGEGASGGDNATWTTAAKAEDVRAEADWLAGQHGIDPKRVVLVGYSEGGLIAPMVAAGDPAIAGIVTLGGPGVSGIDVARYQTEARVDADPTIAPAGREREVEKQLAEPLTPHESSYMRIDPLTYARRVRCPALIIQGGTDLDIPMRSAERLADAMRSGGDADVTVRFFPNISHSLLPDANGVDTAWVTLPAFVTSPDVLLTITDWVSHRMLRS